MSICVYNYDYDYDYDYDVRMSVMYVCLMAYVYDSGPQTLARRPNLARRAFLSGLHVHGRVN